MGSILSVHDRMKFQREFDVSVLGLTPGEMQVWDENPHIRQVFASKREFRVFTDEFSEKARLLEDGFPKSEYYRRLGEAKTVEHWGQRKLLLSEIEFLTRFCAAPTTPTTITTTTNGYLTDDTKSTNSTLTENTQQQQQQPPTPPPPANWTVVYAGAAPGTHINYLSQELFPNVKFVLVDPAEFYIDETENISIRNEYFTSELAKEFANQSNVLFISDIRVYSPKMPFAQVERQVQQDMEFQKNWVQIMRPVASMLKFRLPYGTGQSEYLDGDIYLPVWGGRTTTETRLVVTNCNSMRLYDHKDYESSMFYFNTEFRTSYFPHKFSNQHGLDHCFDCRSEIFILKQYLKKVKNLTHLTEEELDQKVTEMSVEISNQISFSGRTLCLNQDEDEGDE